MIYSLINPNYSNSTKKRERKNVKMAKTYVANYLFNYFGEDKVGDKLIRGATIDVAIRP